MAKDLAETKPQYPDESLPQPIEGKQLLFAPIKAITAPNGTSAGATYTVVERGLINNHTQQIADIEAAFNKVRTIKTQVIWRMHQQ